MLCKKGSRYSQRFEPVLFLSSTATTQSCNLTPTRPQNWPWRKAVLCETPRLAIPQRSTFTGNHRVAALQDLNVANMPSKKNVKQKSADPYTRVACDIRKQLMAMEKKEKKRPRMVTALSSGAEKVVARSFGTSEDPRQPLDHEAATPASFGHLAASDAALARAEAQSPAGGGASSALGILSPAGRHLLLAKRGKPDGHMSPNPHKHYPVTPNPAMKARDRKKKLWRLLVAAMVCVVLAVTAASAGALIYAYRSAVPTCESTGCHLFAKAFQASMDMIVDPCQDFGRYVCGRYSHPRNLSVIEAAAQSYRDEVVAPTRNDSLIGTGQNALQKSWRFYKSCEDVVDDHTDNTAYVLKSMFDCRLSWPDPSPTGEDLLQVIVCLSTKMAWPSLAYLQVDSVAKDVVTMNPSQYTQEILRRVQEINATAYEVFFNAAVEHFRQPDSDTYAINFTAIHYLEMEYARRVGEEAGPLVYYNQELSWVKNIVWMLRQAMPDQVQRYAELRLATNYEHFVHFFSHRVIFPQREDELMLGWHVVLHVAALTNGDLATLFHELIGGSKEPIWKHKKYCFDLTKKYMGLASIMHVSQQRFTNVVRSDVEAMARDVRRMYFSTLEQTTYDWKDLSRVLEFIDVVLSGNIEKVTTNNQVVYSLGDIGDNIVQNMRSMAVSLLHMDESQTRVFMGKQLAQTHEEPFPPRLEQHDISMLPSSLMFPYYEQDVPLSIKYAVFTVRLQ
ncbi:hypothetical protein MRX96_041790 [Rhipicephalus microplus]